MSTTTFRRAVTIAALGLATALGAGCGPEQAPGAGPDPAATGDVDGVGAVGTVEPTTTPPQPPAPPPPGPTDISPTYPDTAEAYAQEVLEAWAGDQPSWLQALTTEAVYYGIVDLNASPNDEWSLLRCDGTAGSSYCSFTNADGDVLTLRISHQLLGQAHAATDVTLTKTTYPDDAVEYVKEFVEAWQFGNTARMVKLSSPAVVNKVPDNPPTSVTYLPLDCCGGGLAQVRVKIGNPTAVFDVGTTLLGEPNAILDYAVEFGLSN
jgi:hypothetical protein